MHFIQIVSVFFIFEEKREESIKGKKKNIFKIKRVNGDLWCGRSDVQAIATLTIIQRFIVDL